MENRESKYCVYCGGKISADTQRCEYCGEWFNESSISRNHVLNNYVSEDKLNKEKNKNSTSLFEDSSKDSSKDSFKDSSN